MRSSSYFMSLAAAVVLILVLMPIAAEGIRLDADTRASVSSTITNSPMVNKPSDDGVKGSTAGSASDAARSAVAASEVREVAHKLPVFHEDYYVPNVHGPRHH